MPEKSNSRLLQRKWPIDSIAAFWLTFCLLAIVQVVVKRPMLLSERYFQGSGFIQVFFMGLYAAWITAVFQDRKNAMKFRPLIWFLFSVIFFLQFFLGIAGLERMLMTGKIHLPVPAMIIAGPI